MALETESMAALTVALLEAVVGIVTSSFILFVILRSIFNGQSLSTRDKILLALSFSNMASPIVLFTSVLCMVASLTLDEYTSVLEYTLVLYCMSSSSWLTLCLCFFYYIKIMHFKASYFSFLKTNIDQLVPWAILVVEVISLCAGFLNAMIELLSENSVKNTSTNITGDNVSSKPFYEVMYVSNFVSYPLMIVTSTCIMVSVTVHIHRMRRSMSTSDTTSLDSLQRVVRTMQHLVAFYLLFFLLLLTEYWAELPLLWRKCSYLIVLLTFSPGQSCILIHGNPRLQDSWIGMWQCGGVKA
ncbi:taste receptor type 2 member 129-like [Anomaloglossus baeobatrachus]|uniref:taste receptor type 2 member 129-like n=1 Tax=Anomaloglossus baeobatrachus TaxID=238106 RepID=UPI003F4F435C